MRPEYLEQIRALSTPAPVQISEAEHRRLLERSVVCNELLEACKDMVDMFERHLNGETGPDDAADRWDKARAAIAKAEG